MLKYYLASRDDPSIWGLTNTGDRPSYYTLVSHADYPELWINSELTETIDGSDYRLNRLEGQLNLFNCASIRSIIAFNGRVEGPAESLANFWVNNRTALITMAPIYTYNSVIDQVDRWYYNGSTGRAALGVWYVGIIASWADYGRVDDPDRPIFGLNDDWKRRYGLTIDGTASLKDMYDWSKEIRLPKVREFFKELPIRRDLFNSYGQVINGLIWKEV